MKMQEPARRGRGRPPKKRESPPQPAKCTISIGNCRVEFLASLASSSDAEGLRISISETCTIDIKVAKESPVASAGFSFTVLHPKSPDSAGKQLLQDVLKLYAQQLPAMKYAANTGKESRFLENCVLGGKYCTLVLRNAELELIGAMTYQMLPADTNQAEIPLAAVAQTHHRQGFGAFLYKELQRRLFDVGVLSIFCWGDQESEPFWAKQGFVTVAEVDGRGKPWKLPIKADVRRAMSIPGSATLMISYLSSPSMQPASPGPPPSIVMSPMTFSSGNSQKACSKISKSALENSSPRLDLPPNGDGRKLSPLSIPTPQVGGESKSSHINTVTPGQAIGESAGRDKRYASLTPFNMEGMFSMVASEDPLENISKPLETTNAPVEIIRPPLADITNSEPALNAVDRPLKKRPITRSTHQQSNVPAEETTTTSDYQNGNVREKELKPDDTSFSTDPKMSRSIPMKEIGNTRSAEPEVPLPTCEVSREAQLELILDKKDNVKRNSKGGMDCDSNSSVALADKSRSKRGRETEAQMSVCTRRLTKRRMADSADPNEDLKTGESNGDQVDKGADQLLDLLLPKVTDCGTANPVHRPNNQKDVERQQPARTEAEPTGRSTGASGHHERNQVESAAQQLLPEGIRLSGAPEQPLKKPSPVVMLMNMADEKKKKQLIKYVERLSGTVTSDGCKCTHVVTGEVRRTLNFCVAISSGAWILSPDWLKTSVKQKNFADEAHFVLRDRNFEIKYKMKLEDVIRRAKERPNLLLNGMCIYLTPHIHPSVDTMSQIVKAAGGKILGSLKEALQLEDKSYAVAVATEEDMTDAIAAAKAGLRTFSSDWLLTCIVKQDLDLTAIQFLESL